MNFIERREEGQGVVEYALALVLVAVVTIAIVTQLGPTIADMYCSITSSLWGACSVAQADAGGNDQQDQQDNQQEQPQQSPEPQCGNQCIIYTASPTTWTIGEGHDGANGALTALCVGQVPDREYAYYRHPTNDSLYALARVYPNDGEPPEGYTHQGYTVRCGHNIY